MICRVENHIGQPALKARVIAELLKQFGVVRDEFQHHPIQRLVVFQLRVLFVGVSLRVLVGLVLRHACRNLLGDDLANLVTVLPLDVAKHIVEGLDDVRQLVDIRRASTGTTSGRGFDEGIRVVH